VNDGGDVFRLVAVRALLVGALIAEAAYAMGELADPHGQEETLGCFLLPVGTIMFFRGIELLFRERGQQVVPGVVRAVAGSMISLAAYVLTTQW
jgi:hypothetical protein